MSGPVPETETFCLLFSEQVTNRQEGARVDIEEIRSYCFSRARLCSWMRFGIKQLLYVVPQPCSPRRT